MPKTNASTRRRARHAGLHVLEQHARVGLHRAGHVADEHERARALARAPPVALDRVALVAERAADGPPAGPGGRRRAARRGAPGRSRRLRRVGPATAIRRMSAAHEPALRVRVLGEVLLAQQLDVGPGGRHALDPDVGRDRRAVVRRDGHARQHELGHVRERLRLAGTGRSGSDVGHPLGEHRVEGRQVLPARAEHGPQREVGAAAVRGVHGGERPVRAQQLLHAHARTRRAHAGGEQGEPAGHRAGRAAQTPSSTPRSRTASMSSRTFSATPSVRSSSAPSSASSACAQAIVSPTPGSL